MVNNEGYIESYDKTRSSKELNGVDIGFLIADIEVIQLIPKGNVSFEATVYPQLVQNKQLIAYQSDQKYHSIGDQKRLLFHFKHFLIWHH